MHRSKHNKNACRITEGVTKKQAYTDADRFRLATVYAIVTVLALWVSVGYWRMTGLM